MALNQRGYDSLCLLVICLVVMVILIVSLPNRTPSSSSSFSITPRPIPTTVSVEAWWDATENLTNWDDAEWEMAVWCVDNWDSGWKCIYGMGDHLIGDSNANDKEVEARWATIAPFIRGLFVHSDERVRATAVWLLAQQGESYDAFRQDESKFVQDTITRWDTGELPAEYDYLGG